MTVALGACHGAQRLVERVGRVATTYEAVYRRSLQEPESFWAEAAERIHWERRWDRVLEKSSPPFYRWFAGGMLNTCYNAIDVHVKGGLGDQLALIYDSPVTGTVARYTYRQLLDEVSRF